jgi:hypothetical protein
MAEKKSNKKTRNWTFVHYEEHGSLAVLIEKIEELHVKAFISPLHDKDANTDGEIKKSHYHVALCFDGPTTFKSVKEFTDELGDPLPQAVASLVGMLRYLTHKDNPEKYQYSDDDIRFLSGASREEYFDVITSTTDNLSMIKELTQCIREQKIDEFADLVDFIDIADESLGYSLRQYEIWHRLLVTQYTNYIRAYMQSRHFRNTKKREI